MSISVNGESQVPPGFRFHPTEEELLQYYLKKKIASQEIDLDVIQDIDLNKLEPWDIQDKCKIGSSTTPQNDWYFFSHKDKKYPTGTRTNRATASGFWKATGRDKIIYSNSIRIGMRKTLVFYTGRAPHGQKSDWIMHEYRLLDPTAHPNTNLEEGWVVCRVFKKKYHSHKTLDRTPNLPITTSTINSCNVEGTLEQILQSMARNQFSDHVADNNRGFLKLPSLRHISPNSPCTRQPQLMMGDQKTSDDNDHGSIINYQSPPEIQDWAALDRLVASHLNGQTYSNNTSEHLSTTFTHHDNHDSAINFCNHSVDGNYSPNDDDDSDQLGVHQLPSPSSSSVNLSARQQDYQNECELWSFAPGSSNDQFCHLSNII